MHRPRLLSSSQVAEWMTTSIRVPSAPTSPDLPLLIPSLVSWYDASDLSTFTYSSGVVVSQWRDKSGNNRHFAQATVANQPSVSGYQNGRNVLLFDGTNDYMDTASFAMPQPFTAIMALNAGADDTQGWFSAIGGSLQVFSQAAHTGLVEMWAGGASELFNASATRAGVHQWAFEFDGANSRMIRDGTVHATGSATSPGTAGTTTGARLGTTRNVDATYFLSGSLFETCVYSRILTTPERQAVEGYLRTKWGLP